MPESQKYVKKTVALRALSMVVDIFGHLDP